MTHCISPIFVAYNLLIWVGPLFLFAGYEFAKYRLRPIKATEEPFNAGPITAFKGDTINIDFIDYKLHIEVTEGLGTLVIHGGKK